MATTSPLELYTQRLIELAAQQLVCAYAPDSQLRAVDSDEGVVLAELEEFFLAYSDELLESEPTVLFSQIAAAIHWATQQAFEYFAQWSQFPIDFEAYGQPWVVEMLRQLYYGHGLQNAAYILRDSSDFRC